jgi:hypothetical protein
LVTLPPTASEAPQQAQPVAPAAAPLAVEPVEPAQQAESRVGKIILITILSAIALFVFVDYVRLRIKLANSSSSSVATNVPAPLPLTKPPPTTLAVSRPKPIKTSAPSEPTSEPARIAEAKRPPPTPPVATKPAAPPPPHAQLAALRAVVPTDKAAHQLTDEEIGKSIQRAVDFLASQFSKSRLKNADNYFPETFAGLNALCVYALLHAGQTIADARLGPQTPLIKEWIARLKESPMEGNRATYSRSLRIAALAVYDRPEDRATLTKDAEWLLGTTMRGAYTYGKPPESTTRGSNNWDNSNSQYGALGIWAATEAGFRAPNNFWMEVESHWIDAQTHSGGWGYSPGAQGATLSMTAAGVSVLFVAREQLGTVTAANEVGAATAALSRPLARGLEWLDEGDNGINIDGGHRGYTLYGIERAGLASGYKYFGKHDWYLELASKVVAEQREDGSWDGGDGKLAETAFTTLFLARGRHPVFMSKLRFEGNWANRSRDLANLTRFASKELERQLNWQTVGLERQWYEWADSPVLYIASDEPPNFTDADVEKLKNFVEAGGLIFTHADKNSQAFSTYVSTLVARLFPQYPLQALPPDHMIYSTVFNPTTKPPLLAVSNGARLLLVHSPTDLARHWLLRPLKSNRPSYETAVNVAVYAIGKREFRNRLSTIYVPEFEGHTIGTIPIARLKYDGQWNPEPGAWRRMARVFARQTSIALDPIETEISDLKFETAPIAHLTGTGAINLREEQIDAMRQFVVRGGVLLIDPCGGSREFTESINKSLVPKLFPSANPAPLPENHPLLAGGGEGMRNLSKPQLRPYAIEARGSTAGQLMSFQAGAGVVVISDLDITSGLLGTSTWGIAGYQPAYAQDLVKNLILWTLSRLPER